MVYPVSLLQVNKSARNDTTNPVRQPPLRSCGLSPTPILRGKAIGAGAPTNLAQPDARLNPHRARGTDGAPASRDFVPWRFSDAKCGAGLKPLRTRAH
jgi:hypothetical protein